MATDDVGNAGETGGARRLKRWQRLTVELMVVGYAGFYLCRSNLSATMPMIIDDLARQGDRRRTRRRSGSASGRSRWGRSPMRWASSPRGA